MQERLNDKHKTFYEVLKLSNESDDPVKSLQNFMLKDVRVKTILGYALNPNYKMPLPTDVPPYIPSTHPLGIAPVEILNTHNKLYIMYNKDTKQYKKEEIFIQWLEDMAPEEAELMLRIKDQTLTEAFPKLYLDVYLKALGWTREQYDSILEKKKASATHQ